MAFIPHTDDDIRQMLATCDMQDHDRLFNALPLFHSFGLTAGLP